LIASIIQPNVDPGFQGRTAKSTVIELHVLICGTGSLRIVMSSTVPRNDNALTAKDDNTEMDEEVTNKTQVLVLVARVSNPH
jgi:hypothetical protein